jgi:hypothetical protein
MRRTTSVTNLVARAGSAQTNGPRVDYVEAIRRTNGEWVNFGIVEAVEYVHAEINWCELDCENLGVVTQYILQARAGNCVDIRQISRPRKPPE